MTLHVPHTLRGPAAAIHAHRACQTRLSRLLTMLLVAPLAVVFVAAMIVSTVTRLLLHIVLPAPVASSPSPRAIGGLVPEADHQRAA